MKIVIAHYQSIVSYPPVISLIDNLLKNHHTVRVVAYGTHKLPERILNNKNFREYDIPSVNKKNFIDAYHEKNILKNLANKKVISFMDDADFLWTTTDFTVRWLGDIVLRYRHIMQLMELIQYYPRYPRFKILNKWRFPIDKYARAAYKVVVPEQNRAYIQQVWWNLKEVPTVLPNKPYYTDIDYRELEPNTIEKLNVIKKEKRKIILYSGVLWFDREFEPFAKAVQSLGDDYCLYVMGSVGDAYKNRFNELLNHYPCVTYLGYFNAPQHLCFYQYAYIGLLPYKPGNTSDNYTNISELNALFCAPNKIYEYARFSLPMIGSNVPGLRNPFEKYGFGICCEHLKYQEIMESIKYISNHYEEMKLNCHKFYDDINLDEIVQSILS